MPPSKAASAEPARKPDSGWGILKSFSRGQKKIVANLEDKSDLYFNKELNRWVERGKENEAAQDPAFAPPPTVANITAAAPVQRRAISQRYVLQSNLSVSSSASSLADTSSSPPLLPPTATSAPPRFFIPGAPSSAGNGDGLPSERGSDSGLPNSTSDGAAPAPPRFFIPPSASGNFISPSSSQQSIYASWKAPTSTPQSPEQATSPDAAQPTVNIETKQSWSTFQDTPDLPVALPADSSGYSLTEQPSMEIADAMPIGNGWMDHQQSSPDQTGATVSQENSSNDAPTTDAYHAPELHQGMDVSGWAPAQPYHHAQGFAGSDSTMLQPAPSLGHLAALPSAVITTIVESVETVTSEVDLNISHAAANSEAFTCTPMVYANGFEASNAHFHQHISIDTTITYQDGPTIELHSLHQNVELLPDADDHQATSAPPAAAATATAGAPTAGTAGADPAAFMAAAPIAAAHGAMPADAVPSADAAAAVTWANKHFVSNVLQDNINKAARNFHLRGKELFASLAELVSEQQGQALDITDDLDADFNFDRIMHPGTTDKLDGPLPWELPDHLKYSDQFISICSNWQKNNPGRKYRPELLLNPHADDDEDAEMLAANPTTSAAASATALNAAATAAAAAATTSSPTIPSEAVHANGFGHVLGKAGVPQATSSLKPADFSIVYANGAAHAQLYADKPAVTATQSGGTLPSGAAQVDLGEVLPSHGSEKAATACYSHPSQPAHHEPTPAAAFVLQPSATPVQPLGVQSLQPEMAQPWGAAAAADVAPADQSAAAASGMPPAAADEESMGSFRVLPADVQQALSQPPHHHHAAAAVPNGLHFHAPPAAAAWPTLQQPQQQPYLQGHAAFHDVLTSSAFAPGAGLQDSLQQLGSPDDFFASVPVDEEGVQEGAFQDPSAAAAAAASDASAIAAAHAVDPAAASNGGEEATAAEQQPEAATATAAAIAVEGESTVIVPSFPDGGALDGWAVLEDSMLLQQATVDVKPVAATVHDDATAADTQQHEQQPLHGADQAAWPADAQEQAAATAAAATAVPADMQFGWSFLEPSQPLELLSSDEATSAGVAIETSHPEGDQQGQLLLDMGIATDAWQEPLPVVNQADGVDAVDAVLEPVAAGAVSVGQLEPWDRAADAWAEQQLQPPQEQSGLEQQQEGLQQQHEEQQQEPEQEQQQAGLLQAAEQWDALELDLTQPESHQEPNQEHPLPSPDHYDQQEHQHQQTQQQHQQQHQASAYDYVVELLQQIHAGQNVQQASASFALCCLQHMHGGSLAGLGIQNGAAATAPNDMHGVRTPQRQAITINPNPSPTSNPTSPALLLPTNHQSHQDITSSHHFKATPQQDDLYTCSTPTVTNKQLAGSGTPMTAPSPMWPSVNGHNTMDMSGLAALKRELQEEFEQKLASKTAEVEHRFESRLQSMRQELKQYEQQVQQYEQQLQQRAAEVELYRSKCYETQAELDELLLCLGQETEKVSALSDAMLAAGLDPNEVTGPIEEKYAAMDMPNNSLDAPEPDIQAA